MEKGRVMGLFSFDGPLYKDKNGVYCSVTLTNEMFRRFFSVVDNLYVIVRTYQSNETYLDLNMKPLKTENMKIIEVENLVSFKGLVIDKGRFEKRIESIISKCDLIFCRMPSITSNYVIKAAKAQGKPYLVEVGGCAWDSYWNHGLSGKLVAPIMFLVKKGMLEMLLLLPMLRRNFCRNDIRRKAFQQIAPMSIFSR